MENKIKQVIVIRKDLKLRRGKECSQAAHASMKFLVDRLKEYRDMKSSELVFQNAFTTEELEWMFDDSFTKICLQVNSEEELKAVHQAALDAGLESNMIVDSGLTEFGGVPTLTCIAIGPDYSENIDPITKNLKLYCHGNI